MGCFSLGLSGMATNSTSSSDCLLGRLGVVCGLLRAGDGDDLFSDGEAGVLLQGVRSRILVRWIKTMAGASVTRRQKCGSACNH